MSLKIEYKKAESGWIEIVLYSEDSSLEMSISEVFDPFEDWFYALERIYRSDVPSIIINPEGAVYRIDIFRRYFDECYFRVVYHESSEELFSCNSTIKEIVTNMYGELMKFARSDRYNPQEYESSPASLGFALKSYRNDILDTYLEGGAFDDNISYSLCKNCGQTIAVKTVNDMLKRAYGIIDKNPQIMQLLRNLKLDKYSVGISQEYSRLKTLNSIRSSFLKDYRPIQGSESGIYLCFSEDFTALEIVEISTRFFSDNHIRGYKAQYNNLTYNQKLELLEQCFIEFNPMFKGFSSYVELRVIEGFLDCELVLKMPNDRVTSNKAYAFYPNSDKYPYFTFNLDSDNRDGRLKRIRLELDDVPQCSEPISKWLSQRVVDIYPDYGECYLWFDGACGSLDDLIEYDLEDTDLARRLEAWQGVFEDNFEKIDIDWVEFDRAGRELFLELREFIKDNYILTYLKSYEERCGTQKEQEMMDLKKI